MIEAKEIVINTCNQVITHYAEKHLAKKETIKVRIDMENTAAKPVFGIFNHSTLLERSTLKKVVRAGGGGALSMIISLSVQNIIKDIFVQSLKQLELKDAKRIYLILRVKETGQKEAFPTISLYKDNTPQWELSVNEIMEVTLAQAK